MAMDMLSKLSLKKVGIPQNGHFSNGEQDENPNLNGSFIEFCHVFSPTFCDENTWQAAIHFSQAVPWASR